MSIFRQLFMIAAIAGLLAGVFVTVVHQVATVPVILAAEVYENAADAAPAAPMTEPMPGMAGDAAAGEEHHHDANAWAPADGMERTLFTGLADILTGIGFSLLLVSAYAFLGRDVDWRHGFSWGLAAFAAFTLAPNLGLPPEVPGTEAAPLLDRQIWWLATVALTAGGLALVFLKRERPAIWYVLAVAMIVLPHAIGAPQPAEHASAAPESLAHQFVVAATMTSLLFWLAIGTLTGYFYKRMFRPV